MGAHCPLMSAARSWRPHPVHVGRYSIEALVFTPAGAANTQALLSSLIACSRGRLWRWRQMVKKIRRHRNYVLDWLSMLAIGDRRLRDDAHHIVNGAIITLLWRADRRSLYIGGGAGVKTSDSIERRPTWTECGRHERAADINGILPKAALRRLLGWSASQPAAAKTAMVASLAQSRTGFTIQIW